MKNVTLSYIKSTVLFSFLFLFAVSCNNDDDSPEPVPEPSINIVETAQDTELLANLVAALTEADKNDDSDLIGTLSGNGPFTVFAPTNEAFTALLGELDDYDELSDFDDEADREILATILKYHVIVGAAALSTDLSDGDTLNTALEGASLMVSTDGGVFIQDATDVDAQVIDADIQTSNGVVHVVNKVLLPQAIIDALNESAEPMENLVEIVVKTEALSILEAAVIKAGLADTLSGDGPFTVFAPTDDAFVALLDILGDDYNSLDDFDEEAEIALLRDVLLYHVVADKVLAADLAEGSVPTALEDNSLEIKQSGDTFVIGDASDIDANITGTDNLASNGVAHTIDKVLLPQSAIDFAISLTLKTIAEIAVETDDLDALVAALGQADAGLVELLGTEGPFTVFAPTNKAFEDALELLGFSDLSEIDTEEEKEILVKILTYHVVAGTKALSTDLSNGQMIATEQGEEVTISTEGGVFIQDATDMDAEVIVADVEASNGVVHIINKVLIPLEILDIIDPNIVGLAKSVDDLSSLVAALVQADAGLVEVLSGDGPFTVFAPTNEAFEDALEALGFSDLSEIDTPEEKEILAEILTYHVLPEAREAASFQAGEDLTTVQGETLEAVENGGKINIDDKTEIHAIIQIEDQMARNGIVHIVNKVLLPDAVLD